MMITHRGVLDDYVNVWAAIHTASEHYKMLQEKGIDLPPRAVENFKASLENKRRRYMEYVKEVWPQLAEKIWADSDKDRVRSLDLLAQSYNLASQDIGGELDFETAIGYVNVAVRLIRGE